jgi:MFS transporter, DHA2 family, glioxin efflux transporter
MVRSYHPLTLLLSASFCVGTSTSRVTGQSVFSNLLLKCFLTPGVEARTVINTGATDIRSSFPADSVPGIIQAYPYALRGFAVVRAYAGIGAMFAAGNKWKRLNPK